MYLGTIVFFLAAIIALYFYNNPLGHSRWFMVRRFINWFPLGMTYAFLCMGRYNLIVAKSALGTLMSKEDLGIIFGVGTWVYALSFLVNGPLIDKKLGGKRGMIIAALGASLANVALGVLTWLIVAKNLKVNLVASYSALYAVNMYFQSYGSMSIIKVKAYWFHVRERGVFGAIFGTLISIGVYFAFDWGSAIIALTKAGAVRPAPRPFRASRPAPWMRPGRCFSFRRPFCSSGCLLDMWLIKDTPEEADFPHFDTHDASSGQMHVEFSTLDLLKRVFTSRLMLLIACVELTGGVFRYSMTQWYSIFAEEIKQPGAEFFSQHWGWLLCIFGIIGGFAGGLISDKLFQSRRGPPAAMLCGFVLIMAVVMAVFLFSQPVIVGWAAVCIVMASIGITSLMSGTAATDFGGRKATATSMGIVNGFAYVGSGIQSISLGFLLANKGGSWLWLPVFVIPFAVIGTFIAIKIWHDLPAATRKYIAEVEQKTV